MMGAAWAERRYAAFGATALRALALSAVLMLALGFAACGGGGGSSGSGGITHNAGTPTGTYNLVVTGTATSGTTTVNHSVSLTLQVQ
ncbi:MAG: hypothetical protein ACRD3D_13590 [Terriglobia bacterium]